MGWYYINVASLYLFIGAFFAFCFFLVQRGKLIGGFIGALIAGILGSFLGAVIAATLPGKGYGLRLPWINDNIDILPSLILTVLFLVVFSIISRGRGQKGK